VRLEKGETDIGIVEAHLTNEPLEGYEVESGPVMFDE